MIVNNDDDNTDNSNNNNDGDDITYDVRCNGGGMIILIATTM